jgi:hypothetical protein
MILHGTTDIDRSILFWNISHLHKAITSIIASIQSSILSFAQWEKPQIIIHFRKNPFNRFEKDYFDPFRLDKTSKQAIVCFFRIGLESVSIFCFLEIQNKHRMICKKWAKQQETSSKSVSYLKSKRLDLQYIWRKTYS